jgi:hypothetical protein
MMKIVLVMAEEENPNQASPPVNQGLPLLVVRYSTSARVSIAERNQEVIDAKCRCWAMDCQEQATRYTLLCPEHEARNLNLSQAPVFGYPSPEAIAVAVDAMVMPHVSWPMKRYHL